MTNGLFEGINTKIKLIQRISFGYRNFGNLRSRIILCTNLFAANPKKRSSNFMLLNLCILAHQFYLVLCQIKKERFSFLLGFRTIISQPRYITEVLNDLATPILSFFNDCRLYTFYNSLYFFEVVNIWNAFFLFN